jgi:hypothetical protein
MTRMRRSGPAWTVALKTDEGRFSAFEIKWLTPKKPLALSYSRRAYSHGNPVRDGMWGGERHTNHTGAERLQRCVATGGAHHRRGTAAIG